MPSYKKITEGKAEIKVPVETKVSKDLPVFYNPVMKFNRDVCVAVIDAWDKDRLKIALPLAGTGVRGIRLLKETKKDKIAEIYLNDGSPEAISIMKDNIELNRIDTRASIIVENHEASRFLFNHPPYDYIDIDPFGSPNNFLDAAIKKTIIDGILAVTATDTSALCGSYTNPCRRKYWATPRHDHLMHEAGLRILIRKCQLVGAQYERALIPILSYSKDHYMRVYFLVPKGKKKVDEIIRQHGFLGKAGPLWLGPLQDRDFLKRVRMDDGFMQLLRGEAEEPFNSIPGFFDLHASSRLLKLKAVPKTEIVMKMIVDKGYKVTKTHFSNYGIKTDMPDEEFDALLQSI